MMWRCAYCGEDYENTPAVTIPMMSVGVSGDADPQPVHWCDRCVAECPICGVVDPVEMMCDLSEGEDGSLLVCEECSRTI